MRCPWCPTEAAPRALHAHLSDVHADAVQFGQRAGRHYYTVECPECHADYEQQVKPRMADERFVDEFRREIRMVAFDMLVNHLLVEHDRPSEEETP